MRKLLSFISDGKENKLIYFRGIRKQIPQKEGLMKGILYLMKSMFLLFAVESFQQNLNDKH